MVLSLEKKVRVKIISMDNKKNTFGRVAITGLHSVVYGYPALVASISLGVIASVDAVESADNHEYVQAVINFVVEKICADCDTPRPAVCPSQEGILVK